MKRIYGSSVDENMPNEETAQVVKPVQSGQVTEQKTPKEAILGLVKVLVSIFIVGTIWYGFKSFIDKNHPDTTETTVSTNWTDFADNTMYSEGVLPSSETEVSNELYDADNMSAEEIFALSNNLFETIEIPTVGMSEDEWIQKQQVNEALWPTWILNNGYAYQPTGSFEHYVDGTSAYIIQDFPYDSEKDYLDACGGRPGLDYFYHFKNIKMLSMSIRITDYDKAMELYELFLNQLKNEYGDQIVQETRSGDFYVIEQQDHAMWQVYVDWKFLYFTSDISMDGTLMLLMQYSRGLVNSSGYFGDKYTQFFSEAGYYLTVYKIMNVE